MTEFLELADDGAVGNAGADNAACIKSVQCVRGKLVDLCGFLRRENVPDHNDIILVDRRNEVRGRCSDILLHGCQNVFISAAGSVRFDKQNDAGHIRLDMQLFRAFIALICSFFARS